MSVIFFIGILSAYAEPPTVATVEYRQSDACHQWEPCYELPKGDLDAKYILVAVNDCGLIGKEGQLTVGGVVQDTPALVFDCKGVTDTDWMSEGNADTPNKVAAELGYNDWIANPEWVAGPVVLLEFERGA